MKGVKQGGVVTGNMESGGVEHMASTWPTQTETEPCAQAQNKQGNIKPR